MFNEIMTTAEFKPVEISHHDVLERMYVLKNQTAKMPKQLKMSQRTYDKFKDAVLRNFFHVREAQEKLDKTGGLGAGLFNGVLVVIDDSVEYGDIEFGF